MIIFFLILEPIKRILSPVIYPISYIFRDRMTTKHVLFNGYLYQYKPAWFLLWLFENDSERFSYKYGIPTAEKYYPIWLFRYCEQLDNPIKRFLLAYWFNAIRNSMVNFNNFMAYKAGQLLGISESFGEGSFELLRQKKKGYRLEYRKFSNGKILPYLEFYLFGKWFQFGWIKNGRFEIDLWKDR